MFIVHLRLLIDAPLQVILLFIALLFVIVCLAPTGPKNSLGTAPEWIYPYDWDDVVDVVYGKVCCWVQHTKWMCLQTVYYHALLQKYHFDE